MHRSEKLVEEDEVWKTISFPSLFDCVNVRVWPLDGALALMEKYNSQLSPGVWFFPPPFWDSTTSKALIFPGNMKSGEVLVLKRQCGGRDKVKSEIEFKSRFATY